MRQPLTRLNFGSYGHCSCANCCTDLDACIFSSLSEEDHGLAVEARQLGRWSQRFACRVIERDDFVLGHAVELPVRPEAKAPWFPELGRAIRSKYANKLGIGSIVFA